MRVVLDTNVIVSASLWKKRLRPIHDAIRQRRITPCFSKATWAELQRALGYRKLARQLEKSNITSERIMKLIASRAYFVPAVPYVEVISEDPADNEILACALASRAKLIVSGDNHLLSLERFQNIPILLPAEFVRTLQS